MLLAFLASAGVAGISVVPAAAQFGTPAHAVGGPVTSYGLSDISLAPGETIVGSPSMMGGPAITHNGGSYQIVDASSVPMAGDTMSDPILSEMPMMQSPLIGGYATSGCATGNCGGSYGTHAMGGQYRGGSGVGMTGNVCGPICNPYIYAALDALYVTNRSVESNDRTSFSFLNDFDYEFGVRGTVGIVPDCRNGMEFSFIGPLDWSTARQATLTGAQATSLAFPATEIGTIDLSLLTSMNDSVRLDAEYFSFEANRTLIGWEICKFLYGIRYVSYDEDYRNVASLASSAPVAPAVANPTSFAAQSSTENQMVGAQVGLDLTYPLTCKFWSDFRGRAGAYANFAENQLQIATDQGSLARNFDDDVELAGLFEIGGGLRYYVTDDFHLRAGTELWYLTGIATSMDQFNPRTLRETRGISINEDILMLGVTVGAEVKF